MIKKVKKIFIIILIIIAILAIFQYLNIEVFNDAVDEVHLIPDNYKGEVYVLYQVKDGILLKENEEGKFILNIPKTGILKVKNDFNSGYKQNEYYYVNKNGEKVKKLNYYYLEKRVPKNENVFITSEIVGTSGTITYFKYTIKNKSDAIFNRLNIKEIIDSLNRH